MTARAPAVSQLRALEAEAVHTVREVVAELERPVLLFSGGKDSIALLRVAEKAFRPAPLPFPILHVDTGHNFPEVLELRDRHAAQAGHELIVASVQDSIDAGRVKEDARADGDASSRNRLQTTTLLDALEEGGFDAAFGGARRDEERARAKERVLSFRDEFGQWEPRAQRPEPWTLYNGRIRRGEHIRVFPLSNWTELDVWRYIEAEELELPSIYFAHRRRVLERDGLLLAESEHVRPRDGEQVEELSVRYRTVGDLTVTGAVRSEATDVHTVIAEIEASTISERGETRADDRTSEAAMEDRKREGYF
jgi:sulfate adenylyltransferase subunit 2